MQESIVAICISRGLLGLPLFLVGFGNKPLPYRTCRDKITTYLFAALLCGGFISPSALAETPVGIFGEISSEYYNSQGRKVGEGQSTFSVFRDGKGWQVKTSQKGSSPYWIASDGKSTFTLISSTSPAVQAIGDAAMIDEVSIPLATPAELIPWWFFILTKNEYAGLTNIPCPWTVPRNDPQAYFFDQDIVWANTDPKVISSVRFFFSPTRVKQALDTSWLDFSSDPVVSREDAELMANEVDTRILAGECSVQEWTNTSLGTFPIEFQVTVFNALVDHQTGVETNLCGRHTGKVNGVQPVDAFIYFPSLERPVWTRDYRFRDKKRNIEAVRYGPADKWATNKTDVDASKAVAIKTKSLVLERNQNSRIIIVVMGCIILAIPCCYLVMRQRSKRIA